MILNDRADIILLHAPLAKSICLSGTQFIIWKQEGLWARGRSLRMTLYKDIEKHSSSKSPAMTFFIIKLYMEKCPFIMLTKG